MKHNWLDKQVQVLISSKLQTHNRIYLKHRGDDKNVVMEQHELRMTKTKLVL